MCAAVVASKYMWRVTPEDLWGVGYLAARRAAERFDPTRGVSFNTFAWPRVTGAMKDDLGARIHGANSCCGDVVNGLHSESDGLEQCDDRDELSYLMLGMTGMPKVVAEAVLIRGVSLSDLAKELDFRKQTISSFMSKALRYMRAKAIRRGLR